jgi:hypothetical protein
VKDQVIVSKTNETKIKTGGTKARKRVSCSWFDRKQSKTKKREGEGV